MGEVYRATDTRLGRQVAIKVLPAALAHDADRLARFDREARTLATLNHPNIAAIHGFEHADGLGALVMELVEGPTLADRLAQGPIPWDDALPIVRQMSDALAAAHAQGIVHRDLKPANVKVRDDGTVKVLDFGLAKGLDPMAPGGADAPGSVSLSPTITSPAMTQAGMILGTAAYMSPEQARGKPVDKRADIWAFGCVLFEMLTGTRAFDAEDVSLTLSKVLQLEPDYARLPGGLPLCVTPALRVCLQKDPRLRGSDIHDVRLALEGAFHSQAHAIDSPGATPTRWRTRILAVATAVAAVLAVVASYGWFRATRPVDRPLVNLFADLGPEAVRAPRESFAFSPDASRIVFVGHGLDPGTRQLFIRRLDQQTATPLPGTVFGPSLAMPFFDPAGDWIGFFTGNTLNKVPADGGSALAITELPSAPLGGAWSDDGSIFVGSTTGLLKVSPGGSAETVVEGARGFLQVLPGGNILLNSRASSAPASLDELNIEVYVTAAREIRLVGLQGYAPRYLPTFGRSGHLVYISRNTLFGVLFDPDTLLVRGTPTRLLDNVGDDVITEGGGQFAVTASGTFAYLTGGSDATPYPIQWLDTAGRTSPLISQPGRYGAPRLSPDNTKLAYTLLAGKGGDVYVRDLQKGTSFPVTFTAPGVREVAWAADSRHLVFGDGRELWWIKADGSGEPQRILEKADNPRPFSLTRDGRLAFTSLGSQSRPDISILSLDLTDPARPKPGTIERLMREGYAEVDPAFSPDGRFLAYTSTEQGPNDVFVRSSAGPGKWKVSVDGGKFPAWTARRLFYLSPDDRIMVRDYMIDGDSLVFLSDPRQWSPTQVLRDGVRQNFDISADGTRAVIFPRPMQEQATGNLHLTFLFNFFDEVRRRIPLDP